MAEGKGRHQWMHTAQLCALIANCHRDPKKGRPYKPEDFDPYRRRTSQEVIEVTSENIGVLKEAFLNSQGRKGV
jgi:hypothetical protein